MLGFLANYATAAHLALLAVAPLFLLPFCGRTTVAGVLLWFSLIAALWVVMSPACRDGEMPHKARTRVLAEMLRDPVMWFSLLAVAFAGIRALNGGIALGYDAETMAWSLKPPRFEMLPGCVDGAGFLLFAASVALFVLLMGARHALNATSATAFFTASSAFAGVAAILSAIALSYGNANVLEMASCSYESPSFAGTAYGLHLIGGVVALFGCSEAGWRRAEPFAAFGLVCSAIGLELFSPPATLAAFSILFLLLVVVSFPLMKGRLAGSSSFRCAIVFAMTVVAMCLVAWCWDDLAVLAAKRDAVLALKPFPAGFASTRDALSSIALKAWRHNPWLGSGIGAFPIDLRFSATQADWSVISPSQVAPLNGWWQLLAERGILGVLVVFAGTAFLVWTYFTALARSIGGERWRPACLIGPCAVVSLAALAFIDCSLMRPDVLLPSAAALSLSAVAFRRGVHG